MKRGREISMILAAVLAFGGIGYAWAQSPGEPLAEEAASAPEPTPVTIRGMQVFIDAESGQLRPPTAKEAAMMSKMMEQMFGKRKDQAKLSVDKDGMGSAELGESYMEFSMARIGADGRLTMDCVDGIEEARAYVAAAASVAKDGTRLEEE